MKHLSRRVETARDPIAEIDRFLEALRYMSGSGMIKTKSGQVPGLGLRGEDAAHLLIKTMSTPDGTDDFRRAYQFACAHAIGPENDVQEARRFAEHVIDHSSEAPLEDQFREFKDRAHGAKRGFVSVCFRKLTGLLKGL